MTSFDRSRAVFAVFFLLFANADGLTRTSRSNLRGRRLEPLNADVPTASEAPTELAGDSGGDIILESAAIAEPAASEQIIASVITVPGTTEETAEATATEAATASDEEEDAVEAEATPDSNRDNDPDLEEAYRAEEKRVALAAAAHEHEEFLLRAQEMADQALYVQELARARAGDIASQDVYDEAVRREQEADKVLAEARRQLQDEESEVESQQANPTESR